MMLPRWLDQQQGMNHLYAPRNTMSSPYYTDLSTLHSIDNLPLRSAIADLLDLEQVVAHIGGAVHRAHYRSRPTWASFCCTRCTWCRIARRPRHRLPACFASAAI